MSIFIQIAAYRDPELLPTIRDCLAKAKWPNDLHFGICWQEVEEASLPLSGPRFRIDRVPYRESRGLCWARSRIQRLYQGEAYTLQLDSHHRFAPHWDAQLLQMIEQTGSPKPILTSYAGVLERMKDEGISMNAQRDSARQGAERDLHGGGSRNDGEACVASSSADASTLRRRPLCHQRSGTAGALPRSAFNLQPSTLASAPFKMVADKFTPSGTILFLPHVIPGWQDLRAPIPARFVSGHFFFTLGQHCEEYTYDPNLYFAGDEISLSIRSYTLGYDLFHPHRCLIWHEYTRAGRPKIWDDDPEWHEKDAISKRRLRALLREREEWAGSDVVQASLPAGPAASEAGWKSSPHRLTQPPPVDLTGYDLGTVRTHHDYELYAGINFAKRELSPCTLRGDDPPCIDVRREDQAFASSIFHFPSPQPWFSSAHCRSAAHCTACRHDPSFRESLVQSGMVAERDFACPFGMSPPDPHEGPGTRLMRLLRRLGFRHSQHCGCQDMALQMNLGGPQWCRENIDQILGVMRTAAAAPASNPLRLPFIECVARRMVLHCARN